MYDSELEIVIFSDAIFLSVKFDLFIKVPVSTICSLYTKSSKIEPHKFIDLIVFSGNEEQNNNIFTDGWNNTLVNIEYDAYGTWYTCVNKQTLFNISYR